MCPDIVETKLLNQREREWKPDPQVINKWTVLYNLQKDYLGRILPHIKAVQNYDDTMHQKLLKEKVEKQNLANLIQFQNKINQDLQKETVLELGQRSFDSTNENCDDDKLKYQHSQVIAPQKIESTKDELNVMANQNHLGDFNKMIFNSLKEKKLNLHDGFKKNELNVANESILKSAISNFIKGEDSKNNFKFAEKGMSITMDQESNGNVGNEKEELAKSNMNNQIPEPVYINDKMDFEKMGSKLDFQDMLSKMKMKDGENIEYLGTSIGTPYLSNEAEETGGKAKKIKKIKMEVGNPIKSKDNEHESESENENEPMLIEKKERLKSKRKMNRHPQSFLETGDIVAIDPQFMRVMKSASNINLETQRRGRRRSRFPDPQWDCAEAQIAKLVKYLCQEEISFSYQKYCKPIFEQVNTMIESYLYHDNHLEICQNLHMCPVTTSI